MKKIDPRGHYQVNNENVYWDCYDRAINQNNTLLIDTDKNTDPDYLQRKNSRYLLIKVPSYIWRKYPEVEQLVWTLN